MVLLLGHSILFLAFRGLDIGANYISRSIIDFLQSFILHLERRSGGADLLSPLLTLFLMAVYSGTIFAYFCRFVVLTTGSTILYVNDAYLSFRG